MGIIWTTRAKTEIGDTIKYWNKKNGSNTYSQKLNNKTKEILSLIKENPYIGEEIEHTESIRRVLVLLNYSIFYMIKENNIYLLSFWDNRRDPENLNL